MFHGFDFDATMLRIGSMNMLLHGVESPDIRYRDSLAQDHTEDAERYTLVLANPPFAGSLDAEVFGISRTGNIDLVTVDEDFSGIWSVSPGENSNQSRFTGAVLANQGKHLARHDFE
jgi:23S rRNA A1618 N6-methylase RlmF